MIDAKLKAAIARQVRLSSALMTVALLLEEGETELYPALVYASGLHRIDQVDLSIAWMELVLRNSQAQISQPWREPNG